MRNLILAVVALTCWTARASIGISVDADLLQNADGTPMPMTGMVLLVASTTDSTFNAPTAGSFVSGDDIIVARFNLMGATNGVLIDFAPGLILSGSWNAGDPLAIYWYPTLATNATAPGGGTPYGFYTTNAPADGSDPWVTPANGTTAIDLRFITDNSDTVNGHATGSNPAAAGLASLVVSGPPTPPSLAVSLATGNVNIRLNGMANANYALQYVNALFNVGTPWQTLATNKADSNGVINFSDPVGTGSRFYRGQLLP
jgi:hypothetical protein